MFVYSRWKKFFYYLVDNKLDFLLVFLASLLILGWLQAAPTFLNSEAFYHAGVAEKIGAGQVSDLFSLDAFHNLSLYDFLLVPFIKIFPTLWGIKLANVLFGSLTILIFYWWLKRHRVILPAAFVLLLLGAAPFLQGLGAISAFPLVLIFMLLGVEAAINYRFWLVFLISLLFTWTSLAAIFYWLFLVIWFLWGMPGRWLKQQRDKTDTDQASSSSAPQLRLRRLGVFIAATLGVVLAAIFYPTGIQRIAAGWQQLGLLLISGAQAASFSLVGWGSVVAPALIVVLLVIFSRRSLSRLGVIIGAFTLILLFAVIITGQFVEYFVFWLMVFLSLAGRDLLPGASWQKIWQFKKNQAPANLIVGLVVIILIAAVGRGAWAAKQTSQRATSVTNLAAVATWLKYHISDEAVIINSSWEDWNNLWYYDDAHRYFITSDPRLLFTNSVAEDYLLLVSGQSDFSPKLILKDRLGGDYLLITRRHQVFNDQALTNLYFQPVYQDAEAWVYKIQ